MLLLRFGPWGTLVALLGLAASMAQAETPAMPGESPTLTPRIEQTDLSDMRGVADTAPYLHDGRATTLTEAILFHGGEAQAARDNFDALSDDDRIELLSFLRSLETPRSAAQ